MATVAGSCGVTSRLPHGYTNSTRRLSSPLIEKRYEGNDSVDRFRREVLCLSHLGVWLPVPEVVGVDEEAPRVLMGNVAGRHGQELMAEGHAQAVMRLVGATLRTLHAVPVDAVAGVRGEGPVLVHGDFGPQNMLFDLASCGRVTALLDWEFAHLGGRVEDIAWAEWIVRTHHPDHIDAVEQLLVHASVSASWSQRHEAMVQRCHELLLISRRAGAIEDEARWQTRLITTDRWKE